MGSPASRKRCKSPAGRRLTYEGLVAVVLEGWIPLRTGKRADSSRPPPSPVLFLR